MRGRGATAASPPPGLNDPRTWSITNVLIVINVIVFLWEVAGGIPLGGGGQAVPGPCVTRRAVRARS